MGARPLGARQAATPKLSIQHPEHGETDVHIVRFGSTLPSGRDLYDRIELYSEINPRGGRANPGPHRSATSWRTR
ncbi:hypothetical protein GCM10020367_20520 [Streptomyces sannanensis]|uniref:Uncharacterized protein n=1 Tax=Streptomyces sannanensis TaxID=285536 RepID=A0ABP6S8W6_9ACTN